GSGETTQWERPAGRGRPALGTAHLALPTRLFLERAGPPVTGRPRTPTRRRGARIWQTSRLSHQHRWIDEPRSAGRPDAPRPPVAQCPGEPGYRAPPPSRDLDAPGDGRTLGRWPRGYARHWGWVLANYEQWLLGLFVV
ncbi:hypothetical protein H1C71_018716, partial [Ictidomys tridecemlineatus]